MASKLGGLFTLRLTTLLYNTNQGFKTLQTDYYDGRIT